MRPRSPGTPIVKRHRCGRFRQLVPHRYPITKLPDSVQQVFGPRDPPLRFVDVGRNPTRPYIARYRRIYPPIDLPAPSMQRKLRAHGAVATRVTEQEQPLHRLGGCFQRNRNGRSLPIRACEHIDRVTPRRRSREGELSMSQHLNGRGSVKRTMHIQRSFS